MWMPHQKDGKNWEVTFSITVLKSGKRIENRTKGFRIRQNALNWIKDIKRHTRETATVKEQYIDYGDFAYTQPKKIKG
tara:strand:+ start:255 stop:488 length:234 start_codon:yes stop_codon:yes gene_type:complete